MANKRINEMRTAYTPMPAGKLTHEIYASLGFMQEIVDGKLKIYRNDIEILSDSKSIAGEIQAAHKEKAAEIGSEFASRARSNGST